MELSKEQQNQIFFCIQSAERKQNANLRNTLMIVGLLVALLAPSYAIGGFVLIIISVASDFITGRKEGIAKKLLDAENLSWITFNKSAKSWRDNLLGS